MFARGFERAGLNANFGLARKFRAQKAHVQEKEEADCANELYMGYLYEMLKGGQAKFLALKMVALIRNVDDVYSGT